VLKAGDVWSTVPKHPCFGHIHALGENLSIRALHALLETAVRFPADGETVRLFREGRETPGHFRGIHRGTVAWG
jgi:hypothetical protein